MVREALAEVGKQQESQFSAFEIEFNALVRKHFPHWDAKDISNLLG